jgi:hypothetical protein
MAAMSCWCHSSQVRVCCEGELLACIVQPRALWSRPPPPSPRTPPARAHT